MPDLLQYPVTRQKQTPDAIEDIFDGHLYKKHFGEDGFLKGTSAHEKQTQVHMSLTINTDGVAVFRSSKFSIWPVYFVVNELPPNCRYIIGNMLLNRHKVHVYTEVIWFLLWSVGVS